MVRSIQQRWTQGELDPKMLGRTDIDHYYGASQTMTNIVTLPQGGFKRRGGLEHIDELLRVLTFVASPSIAAPNGGTGANANDLDAATSLTTTTGVSTIDPYIVASYDLGSAVIIGVVYIQQLALTASGSSSEFFIQVSDDDTTYTSVGSALTITASAKDYSRRIEATHRYVRLARVGATDLGTNKVTFTEMNVYTQAANSAVRIISFEFNTAQSYMLAVTDKNIAVYLDGVFKLDLPVAGLTSARLSDINWAQSADTLIIFHEDINPIIVQRQGADDYWTAVDLVFDNKPYHAFTEIIQTGSAAGFGTVTPSAISGTITLTVASGTFTSASVNQYVEGNGGRARILAVRSATVVDAIVVFPFYNANAIAALSWEYLTGYEEAWSSTRGWPICGTFHTGRLWIGGSRDRPTTAWGSRVGIFYDYDQGIALDDEAIQITLDTDQLNRITNIYSGRNLMLFTTGAEFIVPTSLGEPITPANVSTLRQSRVGAQRGFRVHEIEGGVFYVQSGGQSVQEFLFSDAQQAYANNLISLLSGHLVEAPLDTCLRRATSLDDGALYALVRTDGNATIATIQRSQNIAAFTNHTTDGTFLACGADYDDLYFAVTRGGVNYFERMNDDHLTDASVRVTAGLPAATFVTPPVLDGLECRVIADESVLGRETPTASSVTIDRNAETYAEIGLWFQPTWTDLPYAVDTRYSGNTLGRLLNVAEIVVRLHETRSVKINGKTVSFRGFGSAGSGSPLDSAPPLFTGIKRLLGWRGWDNEAKVTITQGEPATMTILAVLKRIVIGG